MKRDFAYEYNRVGDEEARVKLYYWKSKAECATTLSDTFYVPIPEEILMGYIKPMITKVGKSHRKVDAEVKKLEFVRQIVRELLLDHTKEEQTEEIVNKITETCDGNPFNAVVMYEIYKIVDKTDWKE